MSNWHAESINRVIKLLNSRKSGLKKEEVKKRLAEFGFNELPEKKKINFIFIFLNQFRSYLVYILILAAIISYFIKHRTDYSNYFTDNLWLFCNAARQQIHGLFCFSFR